MIRVRVPPVDVRQHADTCTAHGACAARAQNDYTSRTSLYSMQSSDSRRGSGGGGGDDGYSARASCMTHLLAYLGLGCDPTFGLISSAKSVSEESVDDVAARMRRSMSSRGQDMDT